MPLLFLTQTNQIFSFVPEPCNTAARASRPKCVELIKGDLEGGKFVYSPRGGGRKLGYARVDIGHFESD